MAQQLSSTGQWRQAVYIYNARNGIWPRRARTVLVDDMHVVLQGPPPGSLHALPVVADECMHAMANVRLDLVRFLTLAALEIFVCSSSMFAATCVVVIII